jgi:hypothetical protein
MFLTCASVDPMKTATSEALINAEAAPLGCSWGGDPFG